MPHRFFAPALAADSSVIDLPGDEADHARRVLRLACGDLVEVFDGRGRQVRARVEEVDRGAVRVRILEPSPPARETAVRYTLAQALLKGDAMDDVVRDATMLGVWAVQPLVTDRAIPSLRGGASNRVARWQRIAVSSVKQCGRAVVPEIRPPLALAAWLAEDAAPGGRLMFVAPGIGGGAPLQDVSAQQRPVAASILIGPEGGWSPTEIAQAGQAGVSLVTLGPRVLRAERAAVAILAVLQFAWKDA